MGLNEILALAGQFGALGVLVGFLMWRDTRRDRWAQKHQEERLEADKSETTSREKLASALTALSMVIQGRPHV